MEMEVVIIIVYLLVVFFVIGVFLMKSKQQREEIEDRIDELEREEEMYLGHRLFRRGRRNR